jgi:Holliday junction resolvasome RuvABC endonuclease subunit
METEKELNDAIIKITLKIRSEYPELLKYLVEMPVTIPNTNSPEINIKILKDYYESLNSLLKEYTPNHAAIENK